MTAQFLNSNSPQNRLAPLVWGAVLASAGVCLFLGAGFSLVQSLQSHALSWKVIRPAVSLSAKSQFNFEGSKWTQGLFEDAPHKNPYAFEAGPEQWQELAAFAAQKIFPKYATQANGNPGFVPLTIARTKLTSKTNSGNGLVITRGQFIDLVSSKRSTSLPTRRAREGVLLYSVSKRLVDATEFATNLDDAGVASQKLCGASEQSWKFKRVTLLTDNETKSLECLKSALEKIPTEGLPEEVSLVVLTPLPQLYASASSNSTSFTLQQWHPDWILNLESADIPSDSAAISDTKKRAAKLALMAKALTSPSDVKIEIPVRSRKVPKSLQKHDGIEAVAASEQSPLIFGNFVLVPLELPLNPVRAVRIPNASHRSVSKPAFGQVFSNTKVLIVTGSGNSFRFDAQ